MFKTVGDYAGRVLHDIADYVKSAEVTPGKVAKSLIPVGLTVIYIGCGSEPQKQTPNIWISERFSDIASSATINDVTKTALEPRTKDRNIVVDTLDDTTQELYLRRKYCYDTDTIRDTLYITGGSQTMDITKSKPEKKDTKKSKKGKKRKKSKVSYTTYKGDDFGGFKNEREDQFDRFKNDWVDVIYRVVETGWYFKGKERHLYVVIEADGPLASSKIYESTAENTSVESTVDRILGATYTPSIAPATGNHQHKTSIPNQRPTHNRTHKQRGAHQQR